jgi:hypothetical protein
LFFSFVFARRCSLFAPLTRLTRLCSSNAHLSASHAGDAPTPAAFPRENATSDRLERRETTRTGDSCRRAARQLDGASARVSLAAASRASSRTATATCVRCSLALGTSTSNYRSAAFDDDDDGDDTRQATLLSSHVDRRRTQAGASRVGSHLPRSSCIDKMFRCRRMTTVCRVSRCRPRAPALSCVRGNTLAHASLSPDSIRLIRTPNGRFSSSRAAALTLSQ